MYNDHDGPTLRTFSYQLPRISGEVAHADVWWHWMTYKIATKLHIPMYDDTTITPELHIPMYDDRTLDIKFNEISWFWVSRMRRQDGLIVRWRHAATVFFVLGKCYFWRKFDQKNINFRKCCSMLHRKNTTNPSLHKSCVSRRGLKFHGYTYRK